ncbi:uncharacterized protein LOC113359893 [Papaver somniferum]|uniref:uncharacterized protein LOC113359893 n=1 Tax=Papaver somniferum TaxID=3469 RepID=UPI000E70539F|nr:uncharacterized protein LOC113359893 [Papaver somniferum]
METLDGALEMVLKPLSGLMLVLVIVLPLIGYDICLIISKNINLKVSDILVDGVWSLNTDLQQIIQNLRLPEVFRGEDVLIWTCNLKGVFSIAEAVNKLRHEEQSVSWSRYCICETEQDSINHLLWECSFSIGIWTWICPIFKFKLPKSFDDVWKGALNNSPLVQQVWITVACIILKELWFQKNKRHFEDIKPNMHRFKCRVLKLVHEGGLRITGIKWCQNHDQEIIVRFHLGLRHSRFQCIKKCHWLPPEQGFIMFCCDGSSFGNPGSAGFGVVVKDPACQVVGTLTGGIGVASNYLAETYGVMCALELEIQWSMQSIIIVSDSKIVLA